MTACRTWNLFLVCLALLAAGFLGCSDKGGTTSVPTDAPDKAAVAMANALADGHPDVLWNALPDTYKKDVTELVHQGAQEMDAEMWNRTFGVLVKMSRLLNDKRDFILDHPMVAGQVKDRKDVEKNWESVVMMFDVIVKSELADVAQVRELDIGKFLSGTGREFMEALEEASKVASNNEYADQLKKLRSTKAKVIESSGDKATLEIRRQGEASTRENWVKVEGRWIPATMADGWEEQIATAKSQLDGYSGADAASRQATLMQLTMVEGALDSLIAANSATEFNAGVGAMMGMAMSAAMAQANSNAGSMPGVMPTNPGATAPPSGTAAPTAHIALPPDLVPVIGEEEDKEPERRASRSKRQPIPFHDAHLYLDEFLRVTDTEGNMLRGRLTRIDGNTLFFERNLGGGVVTFEYARQDIDTMRLLR